ncbi:Serine/threonine-protein kinase TAO2 [Frankliniella fusca]|uniref:Serine/threonine-protein kinase TAO2 n=1 Tax=Frankliniella fusca TaxID=407009 RepID=A0AAE1LTZ1_9NEOP|nr:Serine/threonine-protein kinase TAO2 [Frankliniella fusca]
MTIHPSLPRRSATTAPADSSVGNPPHRDGGGEKGLLEGLDEDLDEDLYEPSLRPGPARPPPAPGAPHCGGKAVVGNEDFHNIFHKTNI